MKSLIIINSMNTKSNFTKRLVDVANTLSKKDYDITIKFTKKPHDSYNIVANFGHEFDLLVIAGGDGTLNEVCDGLKNIEVKPRIMYFPTGTVNDFGSSLGMPKRFSKQLNVLENENSRMIDSGVVNDRYFNYVCAYGPFTATSYITSHKLKNKFGKFAYFMNLGKEIPKITQLHELEIEVDDEIISGTFVSALIINSTSIAGFKSLMRNDELDDGYFNLLLIKKTSPIMLSKGIYHVIEGMKENFSDEYYIFRKFKSLKIKNDSDIEWTLDGEKGPIGSIDIQVIKHNLEFLIP